MGASLVNETIGRHLLNDSASVCQLNHFILCFLFFSLLNSYIQLFCDAAIQI